MAYNYDMNSNRLFQIVVMDLTSDVLKLEDELERVINSNLEITKKTNKIKSLLTKITNAEASILKFNGMVSNNSEK